MIEPMHRLRGELGLWRANNEIVRVWIRDDDACRITAPLERLRSILQNFEVAAALGVVPGLLEPDLVALMSEAGDTFVPMCHGWKHINHAGGKEPSEFGPGRPLAAARADGDQAYQVFRKHFPRDRVVFVPPFNRISRAMRRALPGLGFAGLSSRPSSLQRRMARLIDRLAWVPPFDISTRDGIPRIDVHIDLIDWKIGSARADDAVVAALIAQLRLRSRGFLSPDFPIGLLTHHLVHDEKTWRLLERTIAILKDNACVEFVDIASRFQSLSAVPELSKRSQH